jgi:hypothetical protein
MQSIPFIDIRQGGPRQLIRLWPDRAKALIKASRRTLGPISDLVCHFALPQGDRLSRDWLLRTQNPFYHEIQEFAETLKVPGVYALNLCFEWGCTSAIYAKDDGPTLTRVLDWLFPQLGENVVVALQSGSAGDYYNVTWPGLSGMFQGMAPGRFVASLNQAPMQRHKLSYAGDWIKNRREMFRSGGLPPAHLLRTAFERAADFHEAAELLARTPVALPVIYILGGVRDGDGCVIERTERDHVITRITNDRVGAANHFQTRLQGCGHGWRARPIDSAGRSHAANTLPLAMIGDRFEWFRPPIANAHSRLVMVGNARTGQLSAFGAKGERRVTDVFHLVPPADHQTASHSDAD